MNKSSLVALTLGLLAVLSCSVDLVVHAKPVSPRCCEMLLACCQGRLQDAIMSDRVKRRSKVIAMKSTLLGSLHDARVGVEHPGDQTIEESYFRA